MLKYRENGGINWLDNLKLGYGGTKTEMQRLVKDAAAMTDVQEKLGVTVDASSLSFGNIVQAIHVMQESMDINGTTAAEASKTISGSIASMKSAWQNLLPALIQGGDAFDQCVDNLLESIFGVEDKFGYTVGGVINNLRPAITKALSGVGQLIEKLAPIIEQEFPKLVKFLLPPLIKAATSLVKGLIKALPDIVKAIVDELPYIISEIGEAIAEICGTKFPGLESIGNALKENATKVAKYVAVFVGAFAGIKVLTKIIPVITGLFSKSKGGGGNGFLANIGKQFANLGKLKSTQILKGLANLAIIVGGISILTVAIAGIMWVVQKFSSTKEILQMVVIIGALGGVGMALTLFAGVIGKIPIPVVLAGLANLALVLGGVSLLILAFGALNQIKGFNEFITSGGELLANIFNVIGKCVGSIIGGIGEGITNSLPKIGENLSAFAKSLEPMFTSFSNADTSGVGSFLESFGKFALTMAGEKILSIFTGKTDYAALGQQLSAFGESAAGFFNAVATYPEAGFTNATAMFECLAGIKSLPKEGGVAGWFTGNINYTTLADGLGQLASEKVKAFFTSVATLKQAAFDNASALFECLAGLKSMPKEGGVVGWFSGKVNYTKIATGLGQLSSTGVKDFFTMAGNLKEKTFDNVKLLFESLSSIGELPSEGGFWQKLTGNKSTAFENIASQLESFSDKTKTFFEQVNKLKLSNLNGLWDSLNKSADVTADVSKVVDEKISDIVKKITELPEKMGEGLKRGGRSLSEALVEVWTDAVKASVKPVNKVLEAANWILKEFGSEKRVISWTPYAKGTGGHKGGNAMVNDGRGAELVQMPNGRMFIPGGRNVFLPNAPKGMKVLPAEQTARLMGKRTPSYHYADGVGDIDLWSYIDNASGLTSKIADSVSYKGMSGYTRSVGKGMVSTFTGAMTGWVEKLFEEAGAKSLADYVASAGVEQWRTTVIRALKMEGEYSAANVKRTLHQMQTESGGNPKAINLWDSNAKKGIPSKGLMQVIDPTFRSYARSGYNKNIYDPLSNVLASVRYAKSRYGSLAKAYRGVGYSSGVGEISLPTQSSNVRMSYTPESDASIHNSVHTEYNTYAPEFVLNIEGTTDERTMKRKVMKWVREGMDEAFEAMERKTTRLQEV